MLPDGSEFVIADDTASLTEAYQLGQKIGNRLLELGAMKIIEKSRL
jgi:hypothetical protein